MAVPIITIPELELAIGRDLTTQEEARATYYISVISAFIASYCDLVSFEEITDDVVRGQADYYGIIQLGGGPISEVTAVTSVDGTEVGGWTFDGLGMILGLNPFQTVDITYSHGSDEIPVDLKDIAVEAVSGSLSAKVSGPVVRRTVGDVTYVFKEGNNLSIQLSEHTLKQYRTHSYTMRLGPAYERGFNYPVNWFQIGR